MPIQNELWHFHDWTNGWRINYGNQKLKHEFSELNYESLQIIHNNRKFTSNDRLSIIQGMYPWRMWHDLYSFLWQFIMRFMKLWNPHTNCEDGWFNDKISQSTGQGQVIIYIHTVETLYNTVNFCWSTHKRHSIARLKGRGMGCLLWVQSLRATYCVDLSKLSTIKYLL